MIKKIRKNSFAALLLAAFVFTGCGSEQEPESPAVIEGQTTLTMNVDTKAELEVAGKKVHDCKTYVFRKGPGDAEHYMIDILDFGKDDRRSLTIENAYLTDEYSYRFMSMLRVNFEKYDEKHDGTFWELYAEKFPGDNYNWLDADQSTGQAWTELIVNLKLVMESNNWLYENLLYSDMSHERGDILRTNPNIEMKLTGFVAGLSVEIFKSENGKPVPTSDGKSVLFSDEDPDYQYYFFMLTYGHSHMALMGEVSLKESYNDSYSSIFWGHHSSFYAPYDGGNYSHGVSYYEGEEDINSCTVDCSNTERKCIVLGGDPQGSVRVNFPLIPASPSSFSTALPSIFISADSYHTDLSFNKAPHIYMLPGTNTVIKVGIPCDRIWDVTTDGSHITIDGLNTEWNIYY